MRRGDALAAADCNDDLQLITVTQALFTKMTARHDLAIALQRHALADERHGLEQLRHCDFTVEPPRFAIDDQFNHVEML